VLPRLTLRTAARGLLAGASAALLLLTGAPASSAPTPHPRFVQTDLVSGPDGAAGLVDPNLVNPWGLALGPTSPLWVSNAGTATSTVYRGGVDGAPVALALTVNIPGFGPTGQVAHDAAGDPTNFVVGNGTVSASSAFIFSTLAGDIVGWSGAVDRANGIVMAHVDGAVYTGLALWQTEFGPFLLATDFANSRIDVFDGAFRRLPPVFFQDRSLPAGYRPFNVAVAGDAVYVSYARAAPDGRSLAGRGLGVVNRFTDLGLTVRRVARGGTLNAPWGLAVAPESFGTYAGALLVGNFGDGLIGAYRGHRFLGLLRGTDHRPLRIEGLWALLPGTANTGGVNNVWFSAGPADETRGLVGLISPAP
jgi:uncharacterized protein (TIGR03118 family)